MASKAGTITPLKMARKPRVIIIGGGFGGIAAARALRNADAEILLIDRRNHHIFQPLLYQVATSVLSSAEVAAPIRELEVRQKNLSVLLAEVTGANLTERTIDAVAPAGEARRIGFDHLIVATGSIPSYFGHDELVSHAPSLKNLNHAERIRTKILVAFERAAATSDEGERERCMTFVLVGAGATGVELAASLADLAKSTLRRNFRYINPADARIVLLDGADRILPSFSMQASDAVAIRLKKLGVEVVTGVKVETVDENGVVAGGNHISSATVLWTAGVVASPIPRMLGIPTDHAGRALVDPFMRVAPHVFVIGDAASITQGQHPVPGVAQAAIQQGRYVGRLIAKELIGRTVETTFRYFDLGNMAVVGKNYAVLQRGSLHASGILTWLLWAFVHILTLPRLQNRFRVQNQWLWSYLTRQRSSRLIREEPGPT
ncbi:NAD(P)/FAD-dependent oxidoreductase [Dyella humicola]|uniref:NAD(P)/FAD-dependent oxidoreductase n=1 Tax=Dyella humicola TaxID=2992126 RepID=UPI0022594A52|nr:NAD(P)/FAD-dependent oxidoreductase [Dyella humicola]